MKPPLTLLLSGFVLLTTTLGAAFAPGGTAFTKRAETALLSEPRMTAEAVARLPYARELKVERVDGAWVRVKSGRSSGWVFSGNLAAIKPSETGRLDNLPIGAATTTATAAARPLAPAAVEYAARKGLTEAADDLQWLERTSDQVTTDDVQAYLKAERKGEYQ